MTKNIFKTALAVVGAGSLMTGCDFEQPDAGCFVQDSSSWAVKYDLVDDPKLGDGVTDCTDVPPVAEPVGVFKFVDPENTSTPPKLTLRPAGLVSLSKDDPSPSSQQTAIGEFATEADANNFCLAPTLTKATVNTGAANIAYEFTNVRVYSAPSSPGTQLTGELKYTKNGCVSTYVVRAMWPAVPCDTQSDHADENCGEGSGLNPDFAVTCAVTSANGHSGICVPAKAIPSFVESES